MFGNKHIPPAYLRASERQRLDLLRGLMDSDGHIDKARGRAHFCNTNKNIADGVCELVLSLGDVPHVGFRKARGFGVECDAYFVGWKPSVCPVSAPRKAANFTPRKIKNYRAIASVEMVESVPTKCIAVDSDTKTYLAGRSMAVTHNTVFRRLSKWLPLSPEIRDAVEADDDSVPLNVDHLKHVGEPGESRTAQLKRTMDKAAVSQSEHEQPEDEADALRAKVLTLTKPKHNGDMAALDKYLLEAELISEQEEFAKLSSERLAEIVEVLEGTDKK